MGIDLFMMVRLVISLAVVVGLAILILRFGLPWIEKVGRGFAPRQRVRVLETRALDRQHRLALVRYDGEDLLIAFGPGGIETLVRREAEEEPASDLVEEKAPEDGWEQGEPRQDSARVPTDGAEMVEVLS